MARGKMDIGHRKPQRNSPIPIKPKIQTPTCEPLYHLSLPQNPADEPSLESSNIALNSRSLLEDPCINFESQSVFPSQNEPPQPVFSTNNESPQPIVMQRGLLAWEGNCANSGVLLQEGIIIFKPQNIPPQQDCLVSLDLTQLPEVIGLGLPLQTHDNLVEPTPFEGQHDVEHLKLPVSYLVQECDQMIPEFLLPCQDVLEDAVSISELKSSPNKEIKGVVQTLGEREMSRSTQQFDRDFSKGSLIEGERQDFLEKNCDNKLLDSDADDASSVTSVQIKQEKRELEDYSGYFNGVDIEDENATGGLQIKQEVLEDESNFSNSLVEVEPQDVNGNASRGVQIKQETDDYEPEDLSSSSEEEISILPDWQVKTESTTQENTKEDHKSRKKVKANERVKSTRGTFGRENYEEYIQYEEYVQIMKNIRLGIDTTFPKLVSSDLFNHCSSEIKEEGMITSDTENCGKTFSNTRSNKIQRHLMSCRADSANNESCYRKRVKCSANDENDDKQVKMGSSSASGSTRTAPSVSASGKTRTTQSVSVRENTRTSRRLKENTRTTQSLSARKKTKMTRGVSVLQQKGNDRLEDEIFQPTWKWGKPRFTYSRQPLQNTTVFQPASSSSVEKSVEIENQDVIRTRLRMFRESMLLKSEKRSLVTMKEILPSAYTVSHISKPLTHSNPVSGITRHHNFTDAVIG